MSDKIEWVEVVEPNSKEILFANLITGECTWEQPENCLNIIRIHDQSHQWWELYDDKTSRFYYYNANTQETKWQKPKEKGVMIIPLAKFQFLKQNTLTSSSVNKKDCSTQTNCSFIYCSNASTQTSPLTLSRHSHHHSTPHSRHFSSSNYDQHTHSSINERSLRNYLLNEAKFAGLCYDIDENFWDASGEEDYEGTSEESSTDNCDADDEDNNEGDEHDFDVVSVESEEEEEEGEEEEEEVEEEVEVGEEEEDEQGIVRLPVLEDNYEYSDTSSFYFIKKPSICSNGLDAVDNNKPYSNFGDVESLELRKEKGLSEEQSSDLRSDEENKQQKRKENREINLNILDDGNALKPIPPKRGISLDTSLIKQQQQKHHQQNNEELEKYARENIKRHLKKGGLNQMLKRRQSLKGMLIWTKSSIKQPMIATLMNDNDLKQEAINCFKLIQQYCGDRSKGGTKNFGKMSTMIRKEEVAKELINRGVNKGLLLRDEIFVQLCRQTTDNPLEESLHLGLELIALCLYYFSPSYKFAPYLLSFLNGHKKDFARNVCLKKLEKKMEGLSMSASSVGGYCRKPASIEEIVMVIAAIKREWVGIFGESLESLMEWQSNYFPKRKLPWIQVTLSEAILRLGGAEQEGIFRIGGDVEEMIMIKLYIDCMQLENEIDNDFITLCNQWKTMSLSKEEMCIDVNTFACLLKQWFRELKEPVIPYNLYSQAINACESPTNAIFLVDKKLPQINKLVIGYLIRFLQVFSAKQNVDNTKMDENNISMVWAPNILRPPPAATQNHLSLNPTMIFENTRKEMTFIRTLIQFLDTNYIQGVI